MRPCVIDRRKRKKILLRFGEILGCKLPNLIVYRLNSNTCIKTRERLLHSVSARVSMIQNGFPSFLVCAAAAACHLSFQIQLVCILLHFSFSAICYSIISDSRQFSFGTS